MYVYILYALFFIPIFTKGSVKMQICKSCYIKMTGVSSFSDGQMERYYKCQKCKYETKYRKLRKEELNFWEVLDKEIHKSK